VNVRAIVVATHGVMTKTTKRAWTDDFGEYLFGSNVPVWFEKKEFFAGLLSMWNVFVQNRRYARGLADEIEGLWRRHQVPLHFVGHSNGTHVNLLAIKILAERGVPTETMIATGSVLDPDIDKSGISKLICDGQLGRAFAYCSTGDIPLRIPWPFKWPYRDLGRRGWVRDGKPFVDPRIRSRFFDGFGHGDYFAEESRGETFRLMREDMGL